MAVRTLEWTSKAACRLYLDWTPDARPEGEEETRMARTCGRCPVIQKCAQHAVDSQAEGGYYAGVWVPAATSNSRVSARWLRAREQLTRIAKGIVPK